MLVTPSAVGIRENDKKFCMFVLMLRHEDITCGVQTTGPRRSMILGSRCKNHKKVALQSKKKTGEQIVQFW